MKEQTSNLKNPTLINNGQFSLSFWIFINPIESTSDPVSLFSIRCRDQQEETNRIALLYKDGGIVLQINTTNTNLQTKIGFQKWNYIVLTMNEHVYDVLVNTQLVATVPYKMTLTTVIKNTDTIVIGADNEILRNNSLICNVQYHNTPLTVYQMTTMYNLLKTKKTPFHD